MNLIVELMLATLALGPETTRLDATRDLWLSAVGSEAEGNNGGSPKLKLKSIQEFFLIDFDMARLRGRVVRKAHLHLHSNGEPRLRRVTVAGIASEWFEGTGTNYEPQIGSSTFGHRKHPDQPWTADGGDLCRVVFGESSFWGSEDASSPDADGWQVVPVDPKVIASRVAGVTHGFFVFDDTGNEWTREGETFQRSGFPNRFVDSRDSNRSHAPYLTVELGEADASPPAAPNLLQSQAEDLPTGETMLSWRVPADQGAAGVVGFRVHVENTMVDRDLIPRPTRSGETVRMILPNSIASLGKTARVAAIDGAGNVGPASEVRLRLSTREAAPLPPPVAVTVPLISPLPLLGDARIFVIGDLEKFLPTSNEGVPALPTSRRSHNPIWDAGSRTISLQAARNEIVAFQVVLQGKAVGFEAMLQFADGLKIPAELGLVRNIPSPQGPLPDPIEPIVGPLDLPANGESASSVWVDLIVPHTIPAGLHRGTLTLTTANRQSLSLAVNLTVQDFSLPDTLSFLPEMNCYGLPDNERDYYRLAQKHRVVLNRLPYSQSGQVADGCAPMWNGRTLDWNAWDERFGPLLDGSLFADLPRGNVPVELFYLPIHENWPTPIDPHYNGNLWADQAFSTVYRRNLVTVARQFADHFNRKGWDRTLFEAFMSTLR